MLTMYPCFNDRVINTGVLISS